MMFMCRKSSRWWTRKPSFRFGRRKNLFLEFIKLVLSNGLSIYSELGLLLDAGHDYRKSLSRGYSGENDFRCEGNLCHNLFLVPIVNISIINIGISRLRRVVVHCAMLRAMGSADFG